MKRIFLITSLIASLTYASAQSAYDALTFGQTYHGGTARYMAMGGAFNALGGDFSTLSVNPAGLGVYRSNEFTFSTELRFNNTTTGINDENLSSIPSSISETKANFNINSIGYVTNNSTGNSSGLKSINFAFGYNRLKNYHKAYTAKIDNSNQSMTHSWANINNQAELGWFLANEAHLIDNEYYYNDEGNTLSPLLPGATTNYTKDVIEEGRINEWVFSMGGNVDDIIYWGATFGLQDIKMRKEYFQKEIFNNIDDPTSTNYGISYERYSPSTNEFRTFSADNDHYYRYESEEVTNGIGFNGKFGLLFRPLDILRIGLAVHTPTINYLSVDHYAKIKNNTSYYTEYSQNGDDHEYGATESYADPTIRYRTVGPYKVHASAAIILGKHLAIDGEMDMVDYSSMKIKNEDGRSAGYQERNDAIKEMYKVAYNARLGVEIKPVPSFAMRAGMAYYGTPYENNVAYLGTSEAKDAADYVGDRFDYSLGFGYRSGDFFMDFAYIYSVQENTAMVFDDAISPYEYDEMSLDQKLNRYMMTFGFKF